MSEIDEPEVVVVGSASVSERPSKLLMIGVVEATHDTLELAIQTLVKKRKSFLAWLESLGAENIEFGETRFSDQVETDLVSESRRMASQRLSAAMGETSSQEQKKRLVVVTYTASWRIAGLSAEEILVLVDRIRFEAEEFDDTNEEDSSNSEKSWGASGDPAREMSAMLSSAVSQPELPKSILLFSTVLGEESKRHAIKLAYQNAIQEANFVAQAAKAELGEVKRIHWSRIDKEDVSDILRQQRFAANPLRDEIPSRTKKGEVISESPRSVYFNGQLLVTFSLKNKQTELPTASDGG